MSKSKPQLPDSDIVLRCNSGELVLDIDRWDIDGEDADSLLSKCIALNNSGDIDLLKLVDSKQFASLQGHPFFIVQHFFCNAIPMLSSSAEQIMRAVKILVEKGGNDGAANVPNAALKSWCINDLARARRIIELADSGDELAVHFLTFALEAIGDVELTSDTIAKYSDERRIFGITALGRIIPSSAEQASESAKSLLPYITADYEDRTRSNALVAIFNVCAPYPSAVAENIPKAVQTATSSVSVEVLFALARMLWLHPSLFERESVQVAVRAISALDLTKNQIVYELDHAVNALLKTPNADLAIDLLTHVLAADGSEFDLELFKSVKHWLANGDRQFLFNLIVRWLVTGNRQLCESVAQLINAGDRNVPFDMSTGGLGLSSAQQMALSYKALGYLFTNPSVAASILVASIRGSDAATKSKLGELLFDPLLVNYGGADEYLRTIKKGDAAFDTVKKARKRATAYFKNLKIADPVKELRPSEYQRSAERMRAHDMMRQVHKDAEKLSVFASLIHRSTLLYGKKSITFVEGPDEKRRPITMDLHPFSTSFELPRMEVIDPVGLNYTIRLFRAAKFK